MAYTVDWVAQEVTIPTSDLTPVSGDHYSLDMSDFLTEIRRLEWEPTGGLWAPAIVDHSDTRFDFAGADYAPFDEIINGYTIIFSGSATRVDLLGSNNNLVDVLVVSGVSVVPSNSTGLTSSPKIEEVWALHGLDISNPMTVTPATRVAGDITQTISGDGVTTTTVTRDP